MDIKALQLDPTSGVADGLDDRLELSSTFK
jgi:hypothetical protein